MATAKPVATLAPRFSSPNASARAWAEAELILNSAQIYWLTTVRPNHRPHVTPLIAVWHQGALYFCTGEDERKAKNLARNANCILTTGCNGFDGLDIVVEGKAIQVSDEAKLRQIASRYSAKYEGWFFDVRDGAFYGDGGRAPVYEVVPETVFGFGKGEPYSQTRWRFQ
jgi:general stress protein 26